MNTKTTLNSNTDLLDTIYTKTNQMTSQKTFQWIKGEKAGSFVKWDGDIIDDGGINFLSFTDGSRINEELMNEYIIEVANENEPFYDAEFAKPQPNTIQQDTTRPPAKEKAKSQAQPTKGNLIFNLLDDSKKTKTTVSVSLVADMPSVDLMRVLADSYTDGENQVLEYLSLKIDVEDVRKQIAKQIWLQAFSNKRKKLKNEAI